jgi:hypothetical protein
VAALGCVFAVQGYLFRCGFLSFTRKVNSVSGLKERAAAAGYQVTPLGDGVGYEVDFQDGGQNAKMTATTLEGFVGQWEQPLPDKPTTLGGRLRDLAAGVFGV